MKEISKSLAAVSEGFTTAVSNAEYQTGTGKSLLRKYQTAVMTKPIDCAMINNFIKEAKQCTYDSGICAVLEAVDLLISAHKYSWLLETACEQIERSTGTYSYLNRSAVSRVRPLLEMDEADVVSYIKAGALKDVMYCESFRRIAKSVYNSVPLVESTKEYTAVHPISLVEKKDDTVYFHVAGNNYKISEGKIERAEVKELSNDYKAMCRILDSNYTSINEGVLSFNLDGFSIQIEEEGKAKKLTEGKVHEYTVEQLRDHNSMYVTKYSPVKKAAMEQTLECVAKVCENYNNVAIMDNVTVFTTKTNKFIVIESGNNAYAELLESARPVYVWQTSGNIFETVNFIKSKTNTDLQDYYKDSINKVVAEAEGEEAANIRESLRQNEIQIRKEKIEKLTQQFKNDPVKLAVLSKVAEDLNALEE